MSTQPTAADMHIMQNQIRRLMAERDLLLSAIAPADYERVRAQIDVVVESPDQS